VAIGLYKFINKTKDRKSHGITLAIRIPLTHWCRVLTSSQHRYFMYCDFFWIWGCCGHNQ